MNSGRHGDSAMGQLVREALRARSSPGPGDRCLDAATAAAWADLRLDRAARRAVEAHAADCARCQALLAALARTAPGRPAVHWWEGRVARWAVPVAAALSLAVVVWATLPARRAAPPVSQSAPVELPPTTARKTPAAEPAPAPSPQARGESRLKKHASADEVDRQRQQRSDAAASINEPKPPPTNALAENKTLADRVDVVAGAQAPTAKAAIGGLATVDVPSPDPSVRWRLVVRTTIERTIDNGSTWQTQHTGGSVLSAGASPSPEVCWIVGRNGVVLATADGGASWRSIAFPEPVDLTAVAAADAKRATVTAADGRTFTTTDGGRTWTPAS